MTRLEEYEQARRNLREAGREIKRKIKALEVQAEKGSVEPEEDDCSTSPELLEALRYAGQKFGKGPK